MNFNDNKHLAPTKKGVNLLLLFQLLRAHPGARVLFLDVYFLKRTRYPKCVPAITDYAPSCK